MNRNLKFAIAAAVAAMGMTSQAHALTNSTTAGATRTAAACSCTRSKTAANSAPPTTPSSIWAWPAAFDTTGNQTCDFSATAAWTSYIGTIATQPTSSGACSALSARGGAGTPMFTTLSVVPTSVDAVPH